MQLSRLAALLFTASLSLVAACHPSETGNKGRLDFVASDCGQDPCDLAERLAVGATTDVSLQSADGTSVDGLRIFTSDNRIAEVVFEDVDGAAPRATVVGNAPGIVDLLAIDRQGRTVDLVTIAVAASPGLQVDVTGEQVDGPHTAVDTNRRADALYFLGTGKPVDVTMTALDADGTPLMGKVSAKVGLDAAMTAGVEPGDQLDDGHFRINAPVGGHWVVIETPTSSRAIWFEVR